MSGRLPLAEARAREARTLRRMRHVERICRLGNRVVIELVMQLAHGLDDDEVDSLLARFAALNPGTLRALGGDRLPPQPMRAV